ncbi:MAG: OsmC family protein [Nonlabens sp.]
MTASVEYNGNLRCTSVHLKSNTQLVTDAPIDNHGKGQSFSPTDTVAVALASCMLTIMGIKAASLDIDLEGSRAQVLKIMDSSPRRISRLDVQFDMKSNSTDVKTIGLLEKAARSCPVAHSLHPDLELIIKFNWLS